MLDGKNCKNVFTLTKLGDFPACCDRVIEVISLVILKNLQFLAKTDYYWVAVGATRCLKAKIAKTVFTLKILLVFLLFCDRFIKVSSFWPPSNVCTIRQKMLIFVWELMKVDAWRLKVPKICSLWRTLVFFPIFLDGIIKVSSFQPPRKNCNFRQKLAIFGKERTGLDAWSVKLTNMCSLWRNLVSLFTISG